MADQAGQAGQTCFQLDLQLASAVVTVSRYSWRPKQYMQKGGGGVAKQCSGDAGAGKKVQRQWRGELARAWDGTCGKREACWLGDKRCTDSVQNWHAQCSTGCRGEGSRQGCSCIPPAGGGRVPLPSVSLGLRGLSAAGRRPPATSCPLSVCCAKLAVGARGPSCARQAAAGAAGGRQWQQAVRDPKGCSVKAAVHTRPRHALQGRAGRRAVMRACKPANRRQSYTQKCHALEASKQRMARAVHPAAAACGQGSMRAAAACGQRQQLACRALTKAAVRSGILSSVCSSQMASNASRITATRDGGNIGRVGIDLQLPDGLTRLTAQCGGTTA